MAGAFLGSLGLASNTVTWPAVKQAFTQEGFGEYVKTVSWPTWRPSKIIWHNTGAPNLAQWQKSGAQDRANGIQSGLTRIKNLEVYFRDENHWSGAPHLFIAPDFIWVFNPLNQPGVHSPSWNNTSIGIEMVGDFSVDDDECGDGLKVKNNCVYATAILCSALGLEPESGEVEPKTRKTTGTVFIHKQDLLTTHDCPGAHISQDKLAMIAAVQALMPGGEHSDPGHTLSSRQVITTVDNLNVRSGPGVVNAVVKSLSKGTKLPVIGEAKNGSSVWLNCGLGWVSGSFVKDV